MNVKTALTSLDVPVTFQHYSGKEKTYITFFNYNEQGEEWAEDEEIVTGYYTQVDVWSKTDYTDLVNSVKNLMIAAGYIRRNSIDLYEKETQTYHKAMRFIYYE